MKKCINFLKINLVFMLFISYSLESIAQSYLRIEHPLVKGATTNSVYIKAINITPYETKIDFIACFTGYYIYLSSPNNWDSMYIKCNGVTYSLKKTIGISQYDNVTLCEPGKVLEFSAVFSPFLNGEKVEEFDIIEGSNGSWNFRGVSTDKHLASDLSLVYERAYWRGERNWEDYPYKSEWNREPKRTQRKSEGKKKLMKDPNFKID